LYIEEHNRGGDSTLVPSFLSSPWQASAYSMAESTVSTPNATSNNNNPPTKLVKLESGDNQIFEVDINVAKQSVTIKNLIEVMGEDTETEQVIPVPNVSSDTLKKVLVFCEHHLRHPIPPPEDEKEEKSIDNIHPWDKQFCNVDQSTLFEIILAANYLDIKSLLDVTCKTVAAMIRGKTTEEMRKLFNVQNDFSPEEEALIMKENEWVQDG